MKFAMAALLATLLVPTAWAAPSRTTDHFSPVPKPPITGGPFAPQGVAVGGDDIGTAVVIASLPFTDTGNTCDFLNDYDEVCPYTGSSSPDVVYRFTPTADLVVNIDLCASAYDTKLYVYDGVGLVDVACSDDVGGCGSTGWQSQLTDVGLLAGHDYYIVVDGYGSDCGNYALNMTGSLTCPPLACQPWDQSENEPVCFDGYDDQFNGGCNMLGTPAFTPVSCATICGTSGTYLFDGADYRDTDWFEITVGAGTFTLSGESRGFDLQMYVVGPDCVNIPILGSATALECTQASTSFTGPGTFWLWAGPTVFTGVSCGSPYKLTLAGPGIVSCEATAAGRSTWGGLKVLYR